MYPFIIFLLSLFPALSLLSATFALTFPSLPSHSSPFPSSLSFPLLPFLPFFPSSPSPLLSSSQAQYVFLHDAILEGITSGDTEVSVDQLSKRMAELEKTDANGETGYQKEFNVRTSVCLFVSEVDLNMVSLYLLSVCDSSV